MQRKTRYFKLRFTSLIESIFFSFHFPECCLYMLRKELQVCNLRCSAIFQKELAGTTEFPPLQTSEMTKEGTNWDPCCRAALFHQGICDPRKISSSTNVKQWHQQSTTAAGTCFSLANFGGLPCSCILHLPSLQVSWWFLASKDQRIADTNTVRTVTT